MNWKVVIDEETFKFLVDEETNEKCWSFYASYPNGKGYGAVKRTRELCIKSIIRQYREEIRERNKELRTMKSNFKLLLEILKGSDKDEKKEY